MSCKTKAVRLFSSSATRTLPLGRNVLLDIHPEVKEAIHSTQPVVALESTIITHGMPFPKNLKTAQSLENIVRSTGSVPATIGIIDGRVKIGLTFSELERLANTERTPPAVKVSRRDIGPALSMKRDGGTTCSATLIFAALAGIKVFATGGLGGVHRRGHESMDISADLHELARCPVGLVSAGVKSVLDIGRTLEYLETLGVPVLAYGPTNDFPSFFSRRSGYKVPWKVNDPQTAAQILFAQWELGMKNGAVFGVPIPDKYDAVSQNIEEAVEQAIAEAEKMGISKRGKDVTPWLLKRVEELTEGKSLDSNIALVQNNALVGGQIAVQYSKLECQRQHDPYPSTGKTPSSNLQSFIQEADNSTSLPGQLIVIGAAAVDISAQAGILPGVDKTLVSRSTSTGTITPSLGGVGRNIAEAAHRVLASQRLPSATVLVSPVGDDLFGRWLVERTHELGMRTDGLMSSVKKTAVVNMILDNTGELVGGVADMDITISTDDAMVLRQLQSVQPKIVALDGNLSTKVITSVVKYCNENSIGVFFEPTSVVKSTTIVPALAASLGNVAPRRSPITFASPNLLELAHLYRTVRSEAQDLTAHTSWWTVINDLGLGSEFRMDLEQLAKRNVLDQESSKGTLSFLVDNGIAQMAVNLIPFFQNIMIKCGERGLLVALRISGKDIGASGWSQESSNPSRRCVVARGQSSQEMFVLQHFPPPAVETIVNVTGAGDTLVGVLLARLVREPTAILHPDTLSETIHFAQRGAAMTLQSVHAVSPLLCQLGK